MEKLIEALQIFLKYGNQIRPTYCENEELYIVGYNFDDFSEQDLKKLNDLGFYWDETENCFISFKYGSC